MQQLHLVKQAYTEHWSVFVQRHTRSNSPSSGQGHSKISFREPADVARGRHDCFFSSHYLTQGVVPFFGMTTLLLHFYLLGSSMTIPSQLETLLLLFPCFFEDPHLLKVALAQKRRIYLHPAATVSVKFKNQT